VDELNTVIGLLLTESIPANIHQHLTKVQHDLFNIGGEMSLPGHAIIIEAHISRLENLLDELNDQLEPLKEFILPGGSKAAAYCHLARAVCRRAERSMHALNSKEPITQSSLQYINRLSDLLFVLCRTLNQAAGVADILWNNENGK
jgi:cob(I)alamin adenosyltransferase